MTLSYDWRLGLPKMEERDAYFTKTKETIELYTDVLKEKAVVLAHSYGANVMV